MAQHWSLYPRGSRVTVNFRVKYRHRDIWGEGTDQFRSEPWENLKQRWYSITFAEDRDLCLGQQIALVESAYVLLRLMQELGEQAFRERTSLTIESRKGVKSPLIPAGKPAYSMICG